MPAYLLVGGLHHAFLFKSVHLSDLYVLGEDSKFRMADSNNKSDVGASIPGNIIKILVKKGERVEEGQSLAVIEAMKMETEIVAPADGTVAQILVKAGDAVETGTAMVVLN